MAKNRWQRGFDVAKAASRHSSGFGFKSKHMGAALFSGGKLLSVGFNIRTKSHPDHKIHKGEEVWCHNIHAEQAALIKRRHYDGDFNLIMYVWRETADGVAGISKPCEMCEFLCREAGVRRIRYIGETGAWEELKLY